MREIPEFVWEIVAVVAGWCALIGLYVLAKSRIDYRVSERHLQVTFLGIPIRWIRLEHIKYVSTRKSGWSESWQNTFKPGTRLLVIRRRHGLFKNLVITPKNPFVFKAELDRARKRLGPHPRGSHTSRADPAAGGEQAQVGVKIIGDEGPREDDA